MEQPNFAYLNSFSGGDSVFEKKILKVIKQELPAEREDYLNNIASKNFKLASNNVHKLKHKISLLGLEKSYEVATLHERNLIDGDSSFHDNFNEILCTMTLFLDKI